MGENAVPQFLTSTLFSTVHDWTLLLLCSRLFWFNPTFTIFFARCSLSQLRPPLPWENGFTTEGRSVGKFSQFCLSGSLYLIPVLEGHFSGVRMLGREDFLNFGDLSVLSVVSLAGIYLLAFCRFLWLASKAFFLVFCCFTVMPVINLLPFGPKLTLHCPLRDKGAGRCWRGRGGWDCALPPRRRQLSSRGPPV